MTANAPSTPNGPHPVASNIANQIVDALDPRLTQRYRAEWESALAKPPPSPIPLQGRIVLVGHRAAGKSRLLPLMSAAFHRPGVDLDIALEQQTGRSLFDWVRNDEPGFRQAERAFFQSRPDQEINAAGGGFLSLHADLLAGHTPVLVPITFETYCERLMADTRRPRLRPELTLEEELRQIFEAREAAHARVNTVPLIALLVSHLHPRAQR